MRDFFDAVFGDAPGHLLISGHQGRGIDDQYWFELPSQMDDAVAFCTEHNAEDVYFSPALYATKSATKTSANALYCVWVDADLADPSTFALAPTISVETSPQRWQCYWLMSEPITVSWAEAMSRTVTYSNLANGADKGGWARNKLMRVPETSNLKPEREQGGLIGWTIDGVVYTAAEMEAGFGAPTLLDVSVGETPIPDNLPDRATVLAKLNPDPDILRMLSVPPTRTWSDTLYALECALFREGLTAAEVFVLVDHCACDKYSRDNRPSTDLWKDVLRAEADPNHQTYDTPSAPPPLMEVTRPVMMPEFLNPEERTQMGGENFVDRYVAWASTKTRADKGYHHFAALTILSTVLSDFGHGTPRYGDLGLNLFMMIMGETTRTYKTTSKNLMLKVLQPLEDQDRFQYEIPGDVTTEGLLLELSERPGRSSLFVRDEVQQMFADTRGSKSYTSNLSTTFTELYDGTARGRLRSTGTNKKTPRVPVTFSMFTMGVPDRITSILTPEDFASGFLARFLYYIGVPEPRSKDTDRLDQAPLQEITVEDLGLKELRREIAAARFDWVRRGPELGVSLPIRCETATWNRYNDFISDALDEAERSDMPDMIVPSTDRMTKTALKVAILLAMMDGHDQVTMPYMLRAISYAEGWFASLVQVAGMIRASEWSETVHELAEFVITSGQVEWGKAYRKFMARMKPKEFTELVSAAAEVGLIRWTQDSDTRKRYLERVA